MTDRDEILMCRPVADLPEPSVKSRKANCGLCGAAIWVAESSPATAHVWCIPCCAEEMDADSEVGLVSAQQIADLAAHFNRKRN